MTWITLKSGRRLDLANPTQDMFTVEDIAEGLAKECRFNGQCIGHYSVAQHCVHGAHMIEPKFALEFLFHDADEFVWRDMNSPAKHMIGNAYRDAVRPMDRAIRIKFGLPLAHSPEVKEVDNRMYATERRDVAPYGPWAEMDNLNNDIERFQVVAGRAHALPYPNLKIIPWDWRHAREAFMRTFWMLTQ